MDAKLRAVSRSGVEHPIEELLTQGKLDDCTTILPPLFRAFKSEPNIFAVKAAFQRGAKCRDQLIARSGRLQRSGSLGAGRFNGLE